MRKEGGTFKNITLNCLHIYYDLEEYLAIIIMIEGTINYSKYRNEFYILVSNIVFNLHSIPFLLDWLTFARAKHVSSNPVHGEVYSIQHYVIKFVSELQFSSPIKLE